MHTLTICELGSSGAERSEVYLDGMRLNLKALQVVAGVGESTEVTLVLNNIRINNDSGGPDARAPADDAPAPGSVFQTLCHGCGKLFRNGDGHVCK